MKFNLKDANIETNLEALRKEIGSSNMSANVFLTEKDQVFQRAITIRSKKELKLIKPTIDGGLFTNHFDVVDDLEGFFCGDPDEWIPILLRDQYLSSETNTEIVIVDLVFPEGTIYIQHKRSVDILGNESILEEQFILYDKPIIPANSKILTDSELEEYDLKARSMIDPSELGEEEI